MNPSQEFINRLVDITNNYTGSDIESIIRDLAYKAIAGTLQITEDKIIEAFNNSVSMYKTNKDKIDKIKEWAKDRTINASISDETPVSQPVPQRPIPNNNLEVL